MAKTKLTAMMKTVKSGGLVLAMLAASCLVSCSSDDPQWADSEAHEKTEQLREQYTPYLVGTWHIESVKEKWRFFECVTYHEDGTLKGVRKWQMRDLVTIDGREQYTDWQDVDGENGTFTGTWKLSWSRDADLGGNRLLLMASFDEGHDWPSVLAYSWNVSFINADDAMLCIGDGFVSNGEDGTTIYTRGAAEPAF